MPVGQLLQAANQLRHGATARDDHLQPALPGPVFRSGDGALL